MAEMLIDGAKLNACLDAEADAIRAKTGGTDPIQYDYENNRGFADAIASIQTGGGVGQITKDEWTLASDYNGTTQGFYYGTRYVDRTFVGVQIIHIDGNIASSNAAKGFYADSHYSAESMRVYFRGSSFTAQSAGQIFNISAGAIITRFKVPSNAFPT